MSSADGLGRSNRPNVAVVGDQKPVARWEAVYVSTDVFADALRAPSPAASSCDLVLTIDGGGIAEVARDYGGNPALRNPARAAQARLETSPVQPRHRGPRSGPSVPPPSDFGSTTAQWSGVATGEAPHPPRARGGHAAALPGDAPPNRASCPQS